MRNLIIAAAFAALALTACGRAQKAETEAKAPASAEETYTGAGKITAITADQVSIAHGPIEGIGWPAMTMTFTAPADVVQGASVGDQVDFSFRKNGSAYQLTSLRKH